MRIVLTIKTPEIGVPEHTLVRVSNVEVAALCNEPGLTHADIGRRLGLSRERVRQIDLQYNNRTARERRPKKFPQPKECPFLFACRERGMAPVAESKNMCVVNGWRCASLSAHKRHGKYWSLDMSIQKADFMCYQVNVGWLIVPAQRMKGATMVSLNPKPNYGAKSHNHGWAEFLNAWHLLGVK